MFSHFHKFKSLASFLLRLYRSSPIVHPHFFRDFFERNSRKNDKMIWRNFCKYEKSQHDKLIKCEKSSRNLVVMHLLMKKWTKINDKWQKIEKLRYCWCWLEFLASSLHFRSSSFHHFISDFQPSQPQMCKLQQSIESSSASSLACRQQQNLAIVQFSSSFSVAASSPSVGTAHNWDLQQTKRTERNTERNSISRRIKFALKIAFRHTRRSRFCASRARSSSWNIHVLIN